MNDSMARTGTSGVHGEALYTAAQVRELDRRAIAGGIPGFDLMCRAASAAFSHLQRRWPAARRLAVFCGTGNNGGDGCVLAALAHQAGFEVQVWWVGDETRVRGDAWHALGMARQAGVSIRCVDEWFGAASDGSAGEVRVEAHPGRLADVVVDALLGIGLEGAPRTLHERAIRVINASGLPVLALDIPSGLCADTGRVFSEAVQADLTVTFIAAKPGLFTGQGPAICGEVFVEDLAVPPGVFEAVSSACHRVTESRVRACLPRRRRDAHKGHFGHVLVVGGNHGMGGAMLMATEAAGRSGAGLISAASRPEHRDALLVRRPEAMFHAIHDPADLHRALASVSVIVCGPGLGRDDWARAALSACLAVDLPLVLDADALNLLAGQGALLPPGPGLAPVGRTVEVVITPHPGEAARLLGTDTSRLQQDRFDAIRQLQKVTGATVVLKGAGTLIAAGDRVWLAAVGNPGMASGGMGDVLAGIIGGLLAQGLSAADAAACGAWLHGTAADLAARDGERGLLATDLFLPLRRLVNGLHQESVHAR